MSDLDPPASGIDPDPPQASSWIEIDKEALQHNLRALSHHIGDSILCQVVKGNAYGHGVDPIVPLAEEVGVRHFAAFSAQGAYEAWRQSDGQSRIQIMGQVGREALAWIIGSDIEPWVATEVDLAEMRQEAHRQEKLLRVHVELETGMHRTGLEEEQAFDAIASIVDDEYLHLEGVCSHLAGAEDSRNQQRIDDQKQRYHAFLDRLHDHGIDPGLRHLASSAASLLDPDCHLDLCRIGIASYGHWPTYEVEQRVAMANGGTTPFELQRVLSWHSKVIAVREVPHGHYVGYGQSYEAEGDQRIAVVPVGYSDGFSRALGNTGHVLINGQRCTILGNVNMNMLTVHATHIPEIDPGDPVALIGTQGERRISISSFAESTNMVNYELMSRLADSIPRRVVGRDLPGGCLPEEQEALQERAFEEPVTESA